MNEKVPGSPRKLTPAEIGVSLLRQTVRSMNQEPETGKGLPHAYAGGFVIKRAVFFPCMRFPHAYAGGLSNTIDTPCQAPRLPHACAGGLRKYTSV